MYNLKKYTEGVLCKIDNGYHTAKEFVNFVKEYSKDKHNDHNKWPDKYKGVLKWFLVFGQIKSFLIVFYILSGSIISEKITGVNLFGIHMIVAIVFLIITAYFSKAMYNDQKDIRNSYLKMMTAMLIGKTGFLLV